MTKKKKKAEDYTSPALNELMDETDENEYKRTEKRMMLAARIDAAKRAKGWKNKDLAKVLGKKDSEISKWLSGTHNFTADTLSDLEEVLGIQLLNINSISKRSRFFGIFQKCPKLVDNFSKNFLIWRYHSCNITSNW